MIRLWKDRRGGILSTELLLLTSIVVAGLASGLTSVRDAVSNEFADVARSVQNLNQSFMYQAPQRADARTAGSDYFDRRDPTSKVGYGCISFDEIDE